MKKILFAVALLGTSSFVMAKGVNVEAVTAGTDNQVCDGGAASGSATVNGGSGTMVAAEKAVFTKSGFDVQCSANTFVYFQEVNTSLAAVAAGSSKGSQAMGGHTDGGAVVPGGAVGKETDAKCTGTNGICIADDVTKVLGNAVDEGSK
jgi:hypothetical protein